MSATKDRRLAPNKPSRAHGGGKTADRNFTTIVTEATYLMPWYRRFFSKFIHIRAVSSVSDLLGSTIMCPNAILLGALFSFTLTLGTYLLAKNFGYSLSGFEPVGAFILGWIIGIVFYLLASIFKRN